MLASDSDQGLPVDWEAVRERECGDHVMETMAGWLVRLDKAGHSPHNTWNNYDICGTFQIRGDSWIFQTLIDVLILRLDRDEEDGNDPHTILVSLVFQFIYIGMIDIGNWKFTKLGWIWWKFDVWFIFLDLFWVIKLQNMKLLQIDDWTIYTSTYFQCLLCWMSTECWRWFNSVRMLTM